MTKKVTRITVALFCVHLLATGIAAAQRTPVAGYSPHLAHPQPATEATLTVDANRLIRWQGWLDVDAFSASVLEQMQKQVENDEIGLGTFTLEEPSIAKAVADAQKEVLGFVMNDNLNEDMGEVMTDVKLYVWTYRHNFTDTGLYQLYVSAKGKILIGEGLVPWKTKVPHRDIQSLGYEFGRDLLDKDHVHKEIFADVEIWRGAVVRVDARGAIELVGNEAGAEPLVGRVEVAPMSYWERAPSLIDNPNYDPKQATGPKYVAPLDRKEVIQENSVQKKSGDVQAEKRVRTISPPTQWLRIKES